jgi:RNA recognition motif-containing protein
MMQRAVDCILTSLIFRLSYIYLENQPVRLGNARLITDRATGASRGYGYVEFDHPQELITFITITNPKLCGRNVKVDIATGTPREGSERGGGNRRRSENRNNGGGGGGRRESNRGPRGGGGGDSNRRGSDHRQQSQKELPKDVGSQFMGGRYARSDSGTARGGGGSIRRNDSTTSQGSSGMGGGGGGDSSARQRPSLKLAPRTKPLEKTEGSTSQSSIFGGAKPRDESAFLEKKQSDLKAENTSVKETTASMGAMDVNKSNGSGDVSKNGDEATDVKKEPTEKQPPRRQDSKAGGRGGRKDNNGRRDSTRKSGRGGDRGGRGDKNRSGRGDGKNGKRNSTKSNSDNNKNNDKTTQSSLAAAAAAGSMPVKTEVTNKGPPKKTNSFAAFMDDSDED